MQKSFRLIAALTVIGMGIWGARMLFPSPEQAIRSRLLNLARTLSFERKDGILSRGLKAQNFLECFTLDVVVSLDSRAYGARTLTGRDELQQALLVALNHEAAGGLKVEFLDINVTLGPDKQTAVADLTAKATVTGERDFLVQEFNFMLKKADGQWLIYRVETVKTLSRREVFRRIPV